MLWVLAQTLRDLLRPRASLEAEIVALRHQVVVLRRRLGRRKIGLRRRDRALLVLISRVWTDWPAHPLQSTVETRQASLWLVGEAEEQLKPLVNGGELVR